MAEQEPLPCVYLRRDMTYPGKYYIGQAQNLRTRYQGLKAKRTKRMSWDFIFFYAIERDKEQRLAREQEFTEFCWAIGLPITNTHYLGGWAQAGIDRMRLWREMV